MAWDSGRHTESQITFPTTLPLSPQISFTPVNGMVTSAITSWLHAVVQRAWTGAEGRKAYAAATGTKEALEVTPQIQTELEPSIL